MFPTMPAPEMTPLGRAALDSGVSPEDLDAYLAACKRLYLPTFQLGNQSHAKPMWAQAPDR
jgi:hypothetical protein